jgi:hypothetical protein
VRYWVNGEDEDYDREVERVSRGAEIPPAPVAPFEIASIAFLVSVQVLLFAFLIADMLVSLR